MVLHVGGCSKVDLAHERRLERRLPEGTFGLKIPKAMELADSLVEKLLRFGTLRRYGETDLPAARDETQSSAPSCCS